MKTKQINLKLCSLILLVGTLSCSDIDKPEITEETSSKKIAAKTSSVLGYWRDTSIGVSSINGTPGNQKVVVYSVGPISVQAGQVISAHMLQELTYSGAYNIMVGCGIVVGTNANVVDSGSSGFVGWISKPSTSNLSVAEEVSYETVGRNGSYKFTTASNSIYINAMFYAASSQTVPNLGVPSGYGELVAVLEDGVTWNNTNTMHLSQASYRGGALKYIVPITTSSVHRQYSLGISIPANTMVDARFDVEATSEVSSGGNQQLGRNIIQATNATDVTGNFLTRQIRLGITLPEHHSTVSHAGSRFYSSAVSPAYINTVLYGRGWSGLPLYIEGPSSTAYGQLIVEQRTYPNADQRLYEDTSSGFTTVNSGEQILYIVGPMTIDPGQVVEVRYQAEFTTNGPAAIASKIVLSNTPNNTSGSIIQPATIRRFHPNYGYNNMVHSTAYKNTGSTALTNQYFKVIVWKINGSGVCNANTTGELEAVKR